VADNSDRYVVTIDAGSGSCRALVFDQNAKLRGLTQQEWSYKPAPNAPGGLDFDTVAGWQQVCSVVQGALSEAGIDPGQVAAVTATSMREGFVLWDSDGNEIWGVPNVDSRAGAEAAQLIADGLAEPIYRRGGDWTSIAASARMRWVEKNDPEVFQRAAHLTMLGDWVLTRLSGEYVTDPSLGSSSGLFDLASRQWSQDTAADLNLGPILPRVAESGTVVGEVSAKAAGETGLKAGTPVVTGGADTQLGLLGGGAVDGTTYGLVGGTYWLTAAIINEALVDPDIRLRTLCHVVPGRWMIEGVGFVHGLSTRWVRDGLLRAADPSVSLEEGYVKLDALAEGIPPGSNGVSYLGSNVMNAKSWKHGPTSLIGISPFNIDGTGLGAVFRAVLEEGAYVARGHLDALKQVCPEPVEEMLFVGGPSVSRLWSQVVADVLGVPVKVPDVTEATCVGAALCALVGAGVQPDLSAAVDAMGLTSTTYDPAPDAARAYDELYPAWRNLYDHVLAAADQGLVPHMWRGAGA
jgi:autoinducer 2 (AI-2) kinase